MMDCTWFLFILVLFLLWLRNSSQISTIETIRVDIFRFIRILSSVLGFRHSDQELYPFIWSLFLSSLLDGGLHIIPLWGTLTTFHTLIFLFSFTSTTLTVAINSTKWGSYSFYVCNNNPNILCYLKLLIFCVIKSFYCYSFELKIAVPEEVRVDFSFMLCAVTASLGNKKIKGS